MPPVRQADGSRLSALLFQALRRPGPEPVVQGRLCHSGPAGGPRIPFKSLGKRPRRGLGPPRPKDAGQAPAHPLISPSANSAHRRAQVAQSVEQWIENPRVGSSILSLGTIRFRTFLISTRVSSEVSNLGSGQATEESVRLQSLLPARAPNSRTPSTSASTSAFWVR